LAVTFSVFERSSSTDKLIAEDAKGPVIHELIVCSALYHLRWEIVQRATHCRATVRRGVNRPPKITDLDFSRETEKKVLRFNITMHDVLRVQIPKSICDLCNVLYHM
jgi:hypothetical protein